MNERDDEGWRNRQIERVVRTLLESRDDNTRATDGYGRTLMVVEGSNATDADEACTEIARRIEAAARDERDFKLVVWKAPEPAGRRRTYAFDNAHARALGRACALPLAEQLTADEIYRRQTWPEPLVLLVRNADALARTGEGAPEAEPSARESSRTRHSRPGPCGPETHGRQRRRGAKAQALHGHRTRQLQCAFGSQTHPSRPRARATRTARQQQRVGPRIRARTAQGAPTTVRGPAGAEQSVATARRPGPEQGGTLSQAGRSSAGSSCARCIAHCNRSRHRGALPGWGRNTTCTPGDGGSSRTDGRSATHGQPARASPDRADIARHAHRSASRNASSDRNPDQADDGARGRASWPPEGLERVRRKIAAEGQVRSTEGRGCQRQGRSRARQATSVRRRTMRPRSLTSHPADSTQAPPPFTASPSASTRSTRRKEPKVRAGRLPLTRRSGRRRRARRRPARTSARGGPRGRTSPRWGAPGKRRRRCARATRREGATPHTPRRHRRPTLPHGRAQQAT